MSNSNQDPKDQHAAHIQAHADALSQAMGQVSGVTTVQQGQASSGTYIVPAGTTLIGHANSAGSVVHYNGQHPTAIMQITKSQADVIKKKQLELFLSCPPDQREAYLLIRKAQAVQERLNEAGSLHGSGGLNHLQSVFQISGYPGTGFKAEASIQDLEDAHTSDVLEKVVLTDET